MSEPLVKVEGLTKYYYEDDTIVDRILRVDPTAIRAVDGISFEIKEGETLGLVGESGCGKSTAGETMLRLEEPTDGRMEFEGENIYEMDNNEIKKFRRRAQIVFQDPFSSLDPRMTIGDIIREPLVVHGIGSKKDRREKAKELLERVGLSAKQIDRYPHEFSGGQRQRIGVARALALEPDFVVLDEPTSALDVSVQAQILNLLEDLQDDFDLTYLFISHDLGVIRHICDRVAVMYLGEIVEVGPVETIFNNPSHPYTEALLESIPRASTAEKKRRVEALHGDVPSPREPPRGCRFHTRCPLVIPPDDLDVEQDVYREITDYRVLVENRSISLDSIWREASELDGTGQESTEEYPAPLSAFKTVLWDKMFPNHEKLTAQSRSVIEESFEYLADGEWGSAKEVLKERFESRCQSEDPDLIDIEDESHVAACFLRYD
ncbi:MAG: oligopeptide/dipeptide ABC transporter ATP-binding protein [Halobacteria archaeon]|nr:oligopeptide/dipeptide ABC transporter ATP-binding protein [Halobacteria archaeon]